MSEKAKSLLTSLDLLVKQTKPTAKLICLPAPAKKDLNQPNQKTLPAPQPTQAKIWTMAVAIRHSEYCHEKVYDNRMDLDVKVTSMRTCLCT